MQFPFITCGPSLRINGVGSIRDYNLVPSFHYSSIVGWRS